MTEHFAEVAPTWLSRYEERPSFRHRLDVLGAIIREVGSGSVGGAVLDVGGGPGVFTLVASERASYAVCLDTSEAMVQAGRMFADRAVAVARRVAEPRPGRVYRVVGGLDAIVEAERFDLVLCVAVLEYVPDPVAMVRAMANRLVGGGCLILTVPNPRSWFRRFESVAGSAGTTAGRLLGVERLRSRGYVATRPFGNDVPWPEAVRAAGLSIERVVPLAMAGGAVTRRVVPTRIVVLRKAR